MSSEAERLIRRIEDLEAANDDLRRELVRHKRALASTARRVERSQKVTAKVVRDGGAPEIRVELTHALDQFEQARHMVRVALFAYLSAAGDSASEIGRSLGISRQLASRLSDEAKRTN